MAQHRPLPSTNVSVTRYGLGWRWKATVWPLHEELLDDAGWCWTRDGAWGEARAARDQLLRECRR